jgi:hypothetical protein
MVKKRSRWPPAQEVVKMSRIRRAASGAIVLIAMLGAYHTYPDAFESLGSSNSSYAAPVADELEARLGGDAAPVLGWLDSTLASLTEGAHSVVDALPSPAQPAMPSADPADFSFFQVEDGTPVRWDACAPVHYVVNAAHAEPGAEADVAESMNRISAATGLDFVYDGPTTEVPTSQWYAKSWSGRAYAPLVVAWAEPGTTDMLPSARESGWGVANAAVINGEKRFVTGAVVLNAAQNGIYEPGFGGGATRGALLMHEIGHAVGLGHSAAPGQVMYGTIDSATPDQYASGDLAGLSQLGDARGCAA